MKKRSLFAALTLGAIVAYRKLKTRRRILELAEHGASDLKKVGLSQQTFAVLPRHGILADGKAMEWMNLIVAGEGADLKAKLEAAGWYEADAVSPWTLIKSLYAIVTNGQYLRGPFTPIFVNDKPQDFSFQKPDEDNVFAKRHHVRFWLTDQTDKKDRPLWVGHISFDKGVKMTGKLPFLIVHEIDSDIDKDRDYIVRDLLTQGAKLRDYIQFQPAGKAITGLGDEIKSDGRAAVLEVK